MKKYVFLTFSILITLFIWGNSLQNGVSSSEVSNPLTDVVVDVVEGVTNKPANFDLWSFLVRKCGHLTEFALAGLFYGLTFYSFTKKKIFLITSVAVCFLIALIDETIQLSSPGRTGHFTDCLIDLFGALIATLFLFWMIKRKERFQE